VITRPAGLAELIGNLPGHTRSRRRAPVPRTGAPQEGPLVAAMPDLREMRAVSTGCPKVLPVGLPVIGLLTRSPAT
jgi:hypothetical protein